MLTTKILSVLTLILMPMANVSTVIASQDNKDDNTNMSDTLNLSGSLSLSKDNSFASDADSNSSFDDNAESETKSNIIISNTQQEPFVCDEPAIAKHAEQGVDASFENEIITLTATLTPSIGAGNANGKIH